MVSPPSTPAHGGRLVQRRPSREVAPDRRWTSARGRRWTALVALAGIAVVLSACAAGANPEAGPGEAGFWWGLWHGLILPVTFIVSLFNDDVSIYEVANNGNWYDFGYCVGLSMFFSAGPAAGMAGRRR